MHRGTRSSYACARCYKRKKKCDANYPSCSQCTRAKAQCIGLDRSSEAELPRSLLSYLEELFAQLEVERERLLQERDGGHDSAFSPKGVPVTASIATPADSSKEEVISAYNVAAEAFRGSAPAASINTHSPHALPYHRIFFMSAELPFPLAFRTHRQVNVPSNHGSSNQLELPEEVADKLMTVYIERILTQFPIFLADEMRDMYRRFKTLDGISTDEQFFVLMALALATLSSSANDYRKLVSTAEALRRDAFTKVDFGRSCNSSTTSTIQKLLLIAQYGYLLPWTTNLWQVVGDAMRIALALGLHEKVPAASGIAADEVEFRTRLFWVLYAIERSVAVTSHRPSAVAGDQIHLSFPTAQYQNAVDPSPIKESDHIPYMRFVDRLQFLRLQTEICSVNIGMRPTVGPQLEYHDWMRGIEMAINEASCNAAHPKWADFMSWYSMLLLHMPCARNPHPEESSVLKYFDAAIRMIAGYWQLTDSNMLDKPWHAAHHCYEAGMLILYSLWHFRALLRRNYSTNQIFETVHQTSGCFILLVKQWPAAQQCGILFDDLRKGALRHFSEGLPEVESSFEAKQLKDLVFRDNADVLYAREQRLVTMDKPMFEFDATELDIDHSSLGSNLDFLDLFNFSNDPEFDVFNPIAAVEDAQESPVMELHDVTTTAETSDLAVPSSVAKLDESEAQMEAAMQKLPVCSRCKRRRIRCDLHLPSCRNCTKVHQECVYWDNALGEETSRTHIHALHQHIRSLLADTKRLHSLLEATAKDPKVNVMSPEASSRVHTNMTHPKGYRCNILCPTSTVIDLPEHTFFGITSSPSRLVASIQGTTCLEQDITPQSQPPLLLETLCESITLKVATDIPQSQGEYLTRVYSRSIEITFPILGQQLVKETLDQVYDNECATIDILARMRLNLILAISFALLSLEDNRLEVVADAYLSGALSNGFSDDLFIQPTIQSLQLVLLLCIYAWIRPGAMDIWRLLGHATRMCLDIMELQGSNKTESANAAVLHRTLYVLETHIAASFGRPHPLPDGKEASECHTRSDITTSGVSATLYDLARLRHFFSKDALRRDGDSLTEGLTMPVPQSPSRMNTFVHDTKSWLEKWKQQVEEYCNESDLVSGGEAVKASLEQYGQFLQSETLLVAKLATERRDQALISKDEEVIACKLLLASALSLRKGVIPTSPATTNTPLFVFPWTWTYQHTIFTAIITLRQHLRNSPIPDPEIQGLVRDGLELLCNLGQGSTAGLIRCIQYLP